MDPFVAYRSAITAFLVTLCPANRTISLLEVEERCLSRVDEIGTDSCEDTNDGDQDPALGTVEPSRESAPDVLPAPQCFYTVCVGDVVVDPVGGGELVVPHAVVLEDGCLCRVHALLESVASLAQRIHETLTERVAAGEGASSAGAYARGGGQLAIVTRHAWTRGARRGAWEALVGPGRAQMGQAQQRGPLVDALSGPGEVRV